MLTPRPHLSERALQAYAKYDQQMHAAAAALLQNNPKLRHYLEKWLDEKILGILDEAVKHAVVNRTLYIQFSFQTSKLTEGFFRETPNAQGKVDPNTLRVAIEGLLEQRHYFVENGMMLFEEQVVTGEEEEDEEDEGEVDDLFASTSSDGESDLETETELPALEQGVVVGGVYTNGKGIERRVENIREGKVEYVVVKGKGRIKEGTEGKSSYKSFAGWVSEIVYVPEEGEE